MASLNLLVLHKGDVLSDGFGLNERAFIEEIAPRYLPATITSVGVYSSWDVPPEDLGKVVSNARLEVLYPGRPDAFVVDFPIRDQLNFRALQSLRGLQLEQPGVLELRMFLEGQLCQETQIQILPPDPNHDDRNLLEYKQEVNFYGSYLSETDLPGMHLTQDSRSRGADRDDSVFFKFRGEHSGMAIWMAMGAKPKDGGMAEHATIMQLCDIRWVFASEADAQAYHRDSLSRNCEGMPYLEAAPTVGFDCHTFGGVQRSPFSGEPFTNYCYIFVFGRIVAKVYVMQGIDAKEKLTVDIVKAIGEKAASRMRAFQSMGKTSDKPSWLQRYLPWIK